jgi:4-diphosphocytidyl-2-C-methyl-D-erythritol kinase
MTTPLTLPARAKINLHLRVLFRRPDGYHELRTVFQTIDLADTLTLTPRPDGELSLACDDPGVPADERNLCLRAARRLREAVGGNLGAHLGLAKRIPVQAGLGGGSSDAATTLLGLNRLWGLDRPVAELAEIGAALGADVPFFLRGGTALGIGRGDELVPLPDAAGGSVLVVSPSVTVSTAWAYERLNLVLTKMPETATICGLHRVLAEGGVSLRHCANDFELAVFPEFPLLRQIKNFLLEAGASQAMLSGSGGSLFGLFDSDVLCQAAAESLRARQVPGRLIPARFVTRQEHAESFGLH